MSINTRDKRASVIGVDTMAPRLEQNPSGSIGQSGRQIAGLVYSGILAGGAVVSRPQVFTLLAGVSNVFTLTAGDSRAFTLQAGTSGTWALAASTSTTFALQAGRSDTWSVKASE